METAGSFLFEMTSLSASFSNFQIGLGRFELSRKMEESFLFYRGVFEQQTQIHLSMSPIRSAVGLRMLRGAGSHLHKYMMTLLDHLPS